MFEDLRGKTRVILRNSGVFNDEERYFKGVIIEKLRIFKDVMGKFQNG